jgi:Tat protein translocase TatB subunit
MRPKALSTYDVHMSLGLPEMIFIFVLALIIFGPKKLPEIGKQVGKAMAEFKRASNEFKSQLESEMQTLEIQEALKKQQEELKGALAPVENTIANTASSFHESTFPVAKDHDATA